MGLSSDALDLISKAGFERPTPVQVLSLPLAIAGRDLIASAQTGSGKTAAFALPMIDRFVGKEGTYGLVLAPTREIAQQTQATFELFGAPRGVRSIVLIGGIDYDTDRKALNTYPQVIVATPGRLCDHLDRGNILM
jgi:ATP-dependent RNA helicase RhlE